MRQTERHKAAMGGTMARRKSPPNSLASFGK
jgi:hypothetical protein